MDKDLESRELYGSLSYQLHFVGIVCTVLYITYFML